MSTWIGLTVLATAAAMMALGCGQQPAATAAVIEEKTYTVTPAAMQVKMGIVTGDVTELKVTERVDQDSGRVGSPAKLTGNLRLKNTSANQTVWLVSGKIQYVDAQEQPIKLEETGAEATLKFSTYGSGPARPGTGGDPISGRGLPSRGAEGEEVEGDPPAARVRSIAVHRGEGPLHRVHRPGQ